MAAFAEFEDLEAYVQRSLSDLEDTVVLALDLASAAIRAETGQIFDYVEDDTITLPGTWDADLWLPQRPVVDVSAVAVDGLALSDYSWLPNGRLSRGLVPSGPQYAQAWGGPLSTITVTNSHGYATVPGDIRRICLQVASRLIENPAAVQAEQIGNYSVTYTRRDTERGSLTPDEQRALRRYRSSASTLTLR